MLLSMNSLAILKHCLIQYKCSGSHRNLHWLTPFGVNCHIDIQRYTICAGWRLPSTVYPMHARYNLWGICTAYTDYIAKKYGEPIIVFDGYETSLTKDMTHKRWANYRTIRSSCFIEIDFYQTRIQITYVYWFLHTKL